MTNSEKSKFHISLAITDISETVKFYSKLFGSEPIKVKGDYAKFELDNPGLVISFTLSDQIVLHEFGHLGIRVNSNDILEQRKSEVQQFLEIALEEKETNCCHAKQNKFWVADPDGYRWEIYYFIEDVQEDQPKKELIGCC
ncbi:MAG: hypothetical protein JXR10_14640 [Cyclobacteriaceae bacterium]